MIKSGFLVIIIVNCPKRTGFTIWGRDALFFINYERIKYFCWWSRCLWTIQSKRSLLYSFVCFHNQDDDIFSELKLFEDNITKLGFNIKSLHAGPIIRREEEYKNVDREDRKRIFKVMMSFFRKSPLLSTPSSTKATTWLSA